MKKPVIGDKKIISTSVIVSDMNFLLSPLVVKGDIAVTILL